MFRLHFFISPSQKSSSGESVWCWKGQSCCLPSLHCSQAAAALGMERARNHTVLHPVSAAASLPTTPSANHCINSKEQEGRGNKVVCLLPLSDSNSVHISETTPPSWKKNQSPFLLSVGTQNKPRDRSQPSLLENKPRVFSIYAPRNALTSTEIQLLKHEGKPLFYVCQIIQHSKLFRISKDDNTLLVFTNLVITA